MNPRLLLSILAIGSLSSCATMYKSGQTPDDVYYSPAQPKTHPFANNNDSRYASDDDDEDDYVHIDNEQKRNSYNYNENSLDDSRLRMQLQDKDRWDGFYDDYYGTYGYNYNDLYYPGFIGYSSWTPYWMSPWYSVGMGYYPYWGWASDWGLSIGYGAFYGGGLYTGGYYNGGYGSTKASTYIPRAYAPRRADLGGYANGNYNNSNSNGRIGTGNVGRQSGRTYNNDNNSNGRVNNGSRLGNAIRDAFSPSTNNSSGRTYDAGSNSQPTRTYSSPASTGSSGGGVSRPSRPH